MTRTGEFSVADDWETATRNRVASAIDRLSGPLADLAERDANDGDTRILVTDLLSYGLNFNKYEDLTTEYRTSGDSIDYALLLDGALFAPIEVKRVGVDLDARNLQQARRLALNEGAAWLFLTNGRVWQVYHLRPDAEGTSTSTELVLDIDLLAEEEGAYAAKVDALFFLTRESIENGRLDDLRKWREATEPAPLAEAVVSEPVIDAIRTEVRRRTGHAGHVGDSAELQRALTDTVIKSLG